MEGMEGEREGGKERGENVGSQREVLSLYEAWEQAGFRSTPGQE